MGWSDDAEVAFVESGDDGVVEAFGDSDHGCVDDVEAGIGVSGDEFVNPGPVIGGEIDDGDVAELPRSDQAQELLVGPGAEPIKYQPSRLCDHWRWRRPHTGAEQISDFAMQD